MIWKPVFMKIWAGGVVELCSVQRSDDGDVVGDFSQVWQQLRDLRAGLPPLLEVVRRAQQLGRPLDEGKALALNHLFRDVLSIVLLQLGLVVEQIDLRRSAGHEEVNDAFRLGCEVRRLGSERVNRIHGRRRLLSQGVAVQQAGERGRADAEPRLAKEMASGHGAEHLLRRA